MGKTLICIFGVLRSPPGAFESFKKNLLSDDTDLLLSVSDPTKFPEEKLGNYKEWVNAAKYISYYQDAPIEEVLDRLCQEKNIKNEWRQLLQIGDNWLGGLTNRGGSGMIMMLDKYYLREALNKIDLNQYSSIILLRSDFLHLKKFSLSSPPKSNEIYIPDGEHYGGMNDRFLIFNKNSYFKILSQIDLFLDSENLLSLLKTFDCQSFNSESWNLFYNLHNNFEIKLFESMCFMITSPEMQTRWATPSYCEKRKIYYKNKEEMIQAYFNAEGGDNRIGNHGFPNELYDKITEIKKFLNLRIL